MSNEWHREAFAAALRAVGNDRPRNLVKWALPEAEERGAVLVASDLTEVIRRAEPTDSFLGVLGMQIHLWDAASVSRDWTAGTIPSSMERRALICQLLGVDDEGEAILLARRPIFHDGTIVITGPWERWYTAERAAERSFYWDRYREYLLKVRGWTEASVTSLDIATSEVVERLTDPTRAIANQAKGLVVGYVQSGKTGNFTGVIAKAIDAGYRLIIIMTGTIEMLRAQTQRRLDMEMVGRQNIVGELGPTQAHEAKVDYQEDEGWRNNQFLDLGQEELTTEIRRLTHHHKDYQKQFQTLKIDRVEPGRPLYDPLNLFRADARLAVVKKNSTVLKKLVLDIKANKAAFAEIPVLIIDDESDQASVNTVDPEKVRTAKREGKPIVERRAINEQIASLLELMPRAQYVAYTATPFANVFVDPSDEQGIFPKDFVIGLRRPDGYMGIDDFHDFDDVRPGEAGPVISNEAAFVRDLLAPEDDEATQDRELAVAIDMFVLTGAAKKYRESIQTTRTYRHHTMLIHHSVRMADHAALAERVRSIWKKADFAGLAGKRRLADLYQSDVLPVSEARREDEVPALPSFDVLAKFIPQAIDQITQNGNNPVIVVNSDIDVQRQQQVLDFDRYGIWRILVGGAKLSRGFTVEGLTVTYFRRATNMSDSLTQMGRWFGFRSGYRDLVRLYIGRLARFGGKTVDLYEAFRNVAIDEAAFRKQLEQYAEWDGDSPRVLPIQIPPLVEQHLPWLQPTARNKMFNAVLEEQSEQPFTPAGYSRGLDELRVNLDLWRPLLAKANSRVTLPEGAGGTKFPARVGVVNAAELIDAIDQTKYLPWYRERSVIPKTLFYRRLVNSGDLTDFLIIAPQPDTTVLDIQDVGPWSIVERNRRAERGGRFGEITDSKHRLSAERFAGGDPHPALVPFSSDGRGVVLVYLMLENPATAEYDSSPTSTILDHHPERGVVVGFSSYVPTKVLSSQAFVLRFRVRDPSQSNAPSIEVEDANK